MALPTIEYGKRKSKGFIEGAFGLVFNQQFLIWLEALNLLFTKDSVLMRFNLKVSDFCMNKQVRDLKISKPQVRDLA